jgi:SAM-dependent methyltransferase
MDQQTLESYERLAPELCARYRSAEPGPLHDLILGFFHSGEPTADIGSGSGRDLVWLGAHGFPAVGYDASAAMRREATAVFPGLDIRPAALPDLAGVAEASYANVLCSAVLMHLPRTQVATAVSNLARILRPGGRLMLSFRASTGTDEREPDERLFTPIHPGRLTLALEAAGLHLIMREEYDGALRPGVRWTTVLAEKSAEGAP